MQKRTTGFLAWGALILLIGVPGTELLLSNGKDDGTASTKVDDTANLVWQGDLPEQTKRDVAQGVDLTTNASTPRHVGGGPVDSSSQPFVVAEETIATRDFVEEALRLPNSAEPALTADNVLDVAALSDDLDLIPPYPAPYFTRPLFVQPVKEQVVVTEQEAPSQFQLQTTTRIPLTTANKAVDFGRDWRETDGSITYLDTAKANSSGGPEVFDIDVLESYPSDEILTQQRQQQSWGASSGRGGSFESNLPPTRGSRVRLDLVQ